MKMVAILLLIMTYNHFREKTASFKSWKC